MAASIQKTIEIIFAGDDRLSTVIKGVSRDFKAFSNELDSFGAPLDEAARNVLKLETALAAFVAGGLIVAFNESKNFENSVIELKKVLGGGVGVEAAIEDATRLSDIYGQSAADILLSTADFKQAGFNIKDSLTLTKNALDLVIAGNVDAAKSSELIVSALKGFGEGADEATRFIDILNEVSNNYATDVEQLATGMSKLSPIAKQMGFSMEETAGLVTPVIEVFRSGDEAAIALRTGLLKLIDDSKPVAEALTAIGVSQRNASGELRSGRDIYFDVAKAFQTMDQEQKLFITQQLVGIQQSARMVQVFDNLSLATEITSTALGSAGSAAKEVAERLKSAEVAVDRFKVGFENLARIVGDEFRAAAVEAINGGTSIENALRDLVKSDTFKPVFDRLRAFSSEIGVFFESIAADLPEAFEGVDFTALLNSFESLKDALGGLFDDVDLSTPEGIEDAIQLVINTLAGLTEASAGVLKSISVITNSITELIKVFNKLPPDIQGLIGQILGLGTVLTTLAGIVGIGGILLSGISTFAAAFASGGAIATGLTFVAGLLTGPVGLVVALGAAGLALVKFTESGDLQKWSEDTAGYLKDVSRASAENLSGMDADLLTTGKNASESAEEIKKIPDVLDTIPSHKTTDIDVETDQASIDAASGEIGTLSRTRDVDIKASADRVAAAEAEAVVDKAAPPEKTTEVKVVTDKVQIANIEKSIAELTAESRFIEIELQGDIDIELARIKASAEAVQTVFEWKAKLDVANVEAQAKVAVAAFDSIASSVDATSQATSSMFASLLDNWEKLVFADDRNKLIDLVQQQLNLEKEALSIQKELIEAQIEFMRAKTEALGNGEGLIQITSDGLEPSLEMIMWEIIQKVQIRVNEEAGEFALGLNLPT